MKDSKKKNTSNGKKSSNVKKIDSNKKNNNVENKKTINSSEKKGAKRKKSKKLLIVKIILITVLVFIILVGVVVGLFFSLIVSEAPEFDPQNLFTQESSIVYSGSGKEIAKIGTEKREKVTYDDLPQVLIDAIVATEDSAFFQHNGFNAARFLKASLSQVFGGGGGGASTITMQVSKNAYTSDVSSGFEGIKRKFTDIYLSIFKIEKTYTKKQILEFYVNSYYMGGGAYGVEQACQNYFGKSVSDINLAEAAMIAGIFQAPGSYDPTVNPENTEERRQTVLNLMVRHGYISEEEREIASQLTVSKLLNKNTASNNGDEFDSRYMDFINTVILDVREKTGLDPYSTSMLIYTTMDDDKQEYVTNLMNGTNFKWENDVVQAGIAVIDNNNGAVVAVGAGRNREGQLPYNYATMIKKHIGSTAKPLYDYGPLIEYNDASTYHLYYDEPYSYSNGGTINNWDNGYKGLITMREALRISRNIPALKAFQENNNANIIDFVTKLGLSPENDGGFIHEAHAIGAYTGESPLTVAAAYSAFANGGYYTKPYTFTKIVYRNTDEVYEYKPVTTKVMSDATAYMVADMLVTTSGWATNASSVNGITYGSKTGTSNYSTETMQKYHLPSNAVNDLWVAGICRDYATAVWYGYDDLEKSLSSGYYNHGSGNTALYKQLIKGVFTGTKTFTRPSSVVSVTVEKDSPGNGLLPSAYTPDSMKVTELFKAGTEPTAVSSRFSPLSNVSNLTANVDNKKITLQWDGVAANSLSIEHLNSLYASTCRNVSACTNSILGTNQSILGNLVYQVYLKNSDGSFSLLHTTENTNINVEIPKNVGNTATYLVKASYSSYGALASEGVEVKVDISNVVKDDITASLNGKASVEASSYTDEGVKVLEGTTDVTNKATIKKTITKDSLIVTEIKGEGTYKITYDIKYNDFSKTLTRTVVIKSEN